MGIRKAEQEANARKSSWRASKKVHPACDASPLMLLDELGKLAEDIKANGLKFLVEVRHTINSEYVIDGRNRLSALEALGIPLVADNGDWTHQALEYIHFGGRRTDAEIASEVITFNARRKHQTKQELAEFIAEVLKLQKTDSANMAGSVIQDEQTGQLRGSIKDEHKAAVVIEAAKHGVSLRTVERALAKQNESDVPAPAPKVTRRKSIFPKMSRFKRAITNLKNAILWSDVKDNDGRWASDLMIDLSNFLTRRAAALVKGRPAE
jgi:hypothetical protein